MTPTTGHTLRSGRTVEMTAAASRPARRARQKSQPGSTGSTEPTPRSRRRAAATTTPWRGTDRWPAQKQKPAAARRKAQTAATATAITPTAVKTEDDDREQPEPASHTLEHIHTPADVNVKIEDEDEASPPLSSLPYFQPLPQSECHLARAMRGEPPLLREQAGPPNDGHIGCFCRRARSP